MPRTHHQIIERISIALIILGIVGMFQSLSIDLYTWGFHVLLVGTLVFIIISHIPTQDKNSSSAG
ncbi:MAG TPA: hypothetical protein VKY59_17185 [Spirillospora sp.]|nr:hypothetical protein [Spirillospora sp.]